MIVDGHCHVWETWPYQPPVPDPHARGRVEQLLYEMDTHGVDHAVVICAGIGENSANADYAFDAARRYPGRLTVFPDLECRWQESYQTPGALQRLRDAMGRWSFRGFTLYLTEAEDGSWMVGDEGLAFFRLASERRLLASLSVLPHQVSHVVALARTLPELTILLHHFAFLGPRSGTGPESAGDVLDAAAAPNIVIKYSGMGNVADAGQEFPYPELRWIPKMLGEAFGPDRLVWGSDYPVSRRHMTYAQTLSLLTRQGPFSAEGRAAVMGGTMRRLLSLA